MGRDPNWKIPIRFVVFCLKPSLRYLFIDSGGMINLLTLYLWFRSSSVVLIKIKAGWII